MEDGPAHRTRSKRRLRPSPSPPSSGVKRSKGKATTARETLITLEDGGDASAVVQGVFGRYQSLLQCFGTKTDSIADIDSEGAALCFHHVVQSASLYSIASMQATSMLWTVKSALDDCCLSTDHKGCFLPEGGFHRVTRRQKKTLCLINHTNQGRSCNLAFKCSQILAILSELLGLTKVPQPWNVSFVDTMASVWSHRDARLFLQQWIANLEQPRLTRFISALQDILTHTICTPLPSWSRVLPAIQALDVVHSALENSKRMSLKHLFINPIVSNECDLAPHYDVWVFEGRRPGRRPSSLTFFDFPFLLHSSSKAFVIRMEALLRQQERWSGIPWPFVRRVGFGLPIERHLTICIRRSAIIADALAEIYSRKSELHKPLKVVFVDEEAVDEGGPRKEFFHIVSQRILDPSYGMFSTDEDSGLSWFVPAVAAGASTDDFFGAGLLFGLAVYNAVQLDGRRFPKALWKKLMDETVSLTNLAELHPQLARSLQQLLDFEGNVEEVFCASFRVSVPTPLDAVEIDLVQNGDQVPVTNTNRAEFVRLYVDYLLNVSIANEFAAFRKGFFSISIPKRAWSLFTSSDLETVLCGNAVLDFHELEKSTTYDGCKSSDILIRHFWSVVHKLSSERKRRFLCFITGTSVSPIKGLADVFLVICRSGDETRLPSSHTCANTLLLPSYTSKLQLREKLTFALDNCHAGFGLQ